MPVQVPVESPFGLKTSHDWYYDCVFVTQNRTPQICDIGESELHKTLLEAWFYARAWADARVSLPAQTSGQDKYNSRPFSEFSLVSKIEVKIKAAKIGGDERKWCRKVPISQNYLQEEAVASEQDSHASSLRKSPPTCTLSLASVTSGPAISLSISTLIPLVTFPLSEPSRVAFPSEDGSCGGDASNPAEPWRRPRARTSHVETPRRPQTQLQPPPKQRRARISKQPNSGPNPRAASSSAPLKTPTTADLRLAALVERSIALNLAARPLSSSSSNSELDQQDLLLGVRLRYLLALHGRRVRPSSPTRIALPACPPASVLLSGSTGVDVDVLAPSPTPTPAPTLRFIAHTARPRSSSRGSVYGSAGLEMPALVATLLLRRHETGRTASPGTFVLRRDIKRSVPAPSTLGMHVFAPS
ncbi:hypothetical protein K438DRAFT_1929920 [Mycena galopus ATCC 62051]|nr:hypothetical protein K438DRAFT_1929920 [Mycena galopus ATCC 62051]